MLRGIGKGACGGARCFVEESRGKKGFLADLPCKGLADKGADFLIGGFLRVQ
jgi:hypothetical protein